MALHTLKDLLIEQLRDLYNAETQYQAILPSMLSSAADGELRDALGGVIEQVDANLSWPNQACSLLAIEPSGVSCEAMRGLIRETRATLSEPGDPYVIDAALIANSQRIAHYQIAGYGTARQFARVLGEDRVSDILGALAAQAGEADQRLTRVATGGWFTRGVNHRADHAA